MDALDLIHAKVHGLRMIPKYKPSQFEKDLNLIIADEYERDCIECSVKLKELKLRAQLPPQQEKEGLLGGLFK